MSTASQDLSDVIVRRQWDKLADSPNDPHATKRLAAETKRRTDLARLFGKLNYDAETKRVVINENGVLCIEDPIVMFDIGPDGCIDYARHKDAPGQCSFDWGEVQEQQHPRLPAGREGGGRWTAAQHSEAAHLASKKAHQSEETHDHQQAKNAHTRAADAHREEGNHHQAQEHMRLASEHADHATRPDADDEDKPKKRHKALPIDQHGVLAKPEEKPKHPVVSIDKAGSLPRPDEKLTKEQDRAARALCKLPDKDLDKLVKDNNVIEKSKWGQAVALVKKGITARAKVEIDKSGILVAPEGDSERESLIQQAASILGKTADELGRYSNEQLREMIANANKGKAAADTASSATRIMGESMTLAQSKEIDGIVFDRFEHPGGGALRMTDKDSGNVIAIKKYPSLDAARAGYAAETEKAMKVSGVPASPRIALADSLAAKLANGDPITAKSLLDEANKAHGGTRAEGAHDPSGVYDSLEAGFNQALVGNTDPTLDLESAIAQANLIAQRVHSLPTQTNRSGNKDAMQQFSTPPHYAYAVAWIANLNKDDVVLEPSAGTGCLAVQAGNSGAAVNVNELDPARAEFLANLFGTERVTHENAEQIGAILPKKDIQPTAVVMNPPFSQTAGRLGDKKDLMTGANHITQALQTLAPGGRLVAIVGGGVSRDGARKAGMSPESPTYRKWFDDLAKKGYDLRANVGVSGDEYKKYGTHFGTRVLVIDKTGGEGSNKVVTGDVESIPDLMTLLEGVRNDRPQANRPSPGKPAGAQAGAAPGGGSHSSDASAAGGVRVSGKPAGGPDGDQSGADGGGVSSDAGAGSGGGGDAGGRLRRTPAGTEGSDARAGVAGLGGASGHASAGSERPTDGGGEGKPAGGESAQQPGASLSGLRPAAPVTVGTRKAAAKDTSSSSEELGPSLFESYQPYATVAGSQPHPSPLVESSAMAGVKPPEPTYAPTLSPDQIQSGMFSGAQLEAIIYAGQAHQQMLPAGEGEEQARRGFFIGDGTGVGKGREIAGILADNINQGRKKHVWVSQKQNLFEDAKRDVRNVGMDPNSVVHFDKIRKAAAAGKQIGDGIGFVTYDTLKGRPKDPTKASNLDTLVDWLGKDFDGVIVFDEAHGMSNAINTEGGRGIKKASARALAGVELQKKLPKARVVYVSATGATEVSNLAYAERLGIWGRETPFATKQDFIQKMDEGGVAAMEAVAQSLKATGGYMARSLSFDDGTPEGKVTYERLTHQLSPEQLETYNGLADGWQNVLANIDAALASSGAGDSAQAKSAALSQFWGAQQRFFNQVMTSMQTPSVINAMEKDIKEGRAPVVQLVNTMEAATKRALARQSAKGDEDADDFEEMDVSPREVLMQYLENSFPVHRWETYTDGDGNERQRLVTDSNGEPVVDPEAARMRDEMLDMVGTLRIPESPLDMILNHFGHENVAECTGRTQRVIAKEQEDGTRKKVLDRRNIVNSNAAEAHDFQSGKKKILVFSDAGGTGRSYHADRNADNQNQRVHYMLQPGWRADNAVQGLGRTHRTNQALAPTYRLVEIADLKAQKRFVSTIARRLDQLGALTRGQRQAGGGGLFSAADNLESPEARVALDRFFTDLEHGAVDGLNHREVMKQLGFKTEDKDGNPVDVETPPMSQFLNRLLSLRVDMQATVFDAFDHRLQETVERAIENGSMDTGVENFPAESLAKKGDRVVYKDPNSGAEVRHFVVAATSKAKKRTWGANLQGEKPLHFVKDNDGQVWAAYKATDETNARTGQITARYRLRGPGSDKYRPAYEIDQPYFGFAKIEQDAAKTLWEQQHAAIPDTTTSDENFVTGAMLPIWDRIPGNKPKIYRLKTADGDSVVGRHIPKKAVPALMKNLGVGHEGEMHDAADVHGRMVSGQVKTATLATGWKLKTSMVAGERRIELTGGAGQAIPNAVMRQLEADGVIRERISYETRFFVPVGAAGAKVLERITKARPIVDVDEK